MQTNNQVQVFLANLVTMEKNVVYIMKTRGNVGNVSFRYSYFLNECASQGQILLNFIDHLGESFNKGDFSIYNDYLEAIQMVNNYISQYNN
jgi:hypothetical protein